MRTDKRIVEAIPPRRQWDPRVVSGAKRVNSGEDPDRVALDLAMVVPGFTRTQLGAYAAAYNKDLEKRRLARKKEGNDRKAIIVVPPESLAEDEDGRLAAVNGERVTVSSYQYADGDFYVRTKALGRVSVPGTWLRDVTGKHPFDAEAIGLKEGLFSAGEPDVADRDNKERAVQALLGSEDVDVKKVPDEKLSGLIQGLGSITTESIDSQVAQIVSVMREQHASRDDVLEALQVHVGFNLREAKEVLQEYLREGAKQHAEMLTPSERSHYKPGSKSRVIKEATTDITYYANHLRKQFQGLSFTVAGLDKDMVIHVLAAFHYYFDKEEDPDLAMKILSKKWTAGEWGYTSSKGKVPRAKEAEALPKVVGWYNDFLEDREPLQEGAPKEGNVRKVDYKGYTITVHKNRAGMYTAKNDSGEPYTNVPQFRSAEEAIAWDKKNVDQMTESSSPNKTGVRYGVFSRGGSVGSKHNGPIETFDSVEDAKQYAARLRKTLTPGERSYYKMGYVVRALKEAAKIKPEDFGIDNYDFDSNGFLDVYQSVNLASSKLTSLPFKFGKVDGDFNCSVNTLASLEGAPQKVGGDFYCTDNNLTSLEGAPREVDGTFACYDNKLTSLKGAPQKVGNFYCSYNELLSLEGAPQKVRGTFDCYNNNLTSLKGAPREVDGDFSCSYNELSSLEGAPLKVGGSFDCCDNNLHSLEGAPREVGGDFGCAFNLTRFTIEDVRKVCKAAGLIHV